MAPADSVFDPWRIPLVGRDALLANALDFAASMPGCLVIVGEPKAGSTRFASDLVERLSDNDRPAVWAENDSIEIEERLRSALSIAGLDPEPTRAASRTGFVAFLGRCGDIRSPGRLARALRGTAGLVVLTSSHAVEAPVIELPPLGDDESRALVQEASPELDSETVVRIAALSDGLPGCLVSLARSTVAGQSDQDIHLAPDLCELIATRLTALSPHDLEIARWTALLGETDRDALMRVTGESPQLVDASIQALIEPGVLTWVNGELRFRHRLTQMAVSALSPRALMSPESVEATIVAPARRRDISASAAVAIVIEQARLAAEDANRRRWTAVLTHAQRGIDVLGDAGVGPEHRPILLERKAEALENLVRLPQAFACYEEAAAGFQELGDEPATSRCLVRARSVRSRAGAHADAIRGLLRDAGAIAAGGGSSAHRWQAIAEAAIVALEGWHNSLSESLATRVLAAPSSEVSVSARLAATVARAACRLDAAGAAALKDLSEVRAAAVDANEFRIATFATRCEIYGLSLVGKPEQAVAHAAAVRSEIRDRGGHGHDYEFAYPMLVAFGDAGQLPQARAHLEELRRSEPEIGSAAFDGLAEAMLMRLDGRLEPAMERLYSLAALLEGVDRVPLVSIAEELALTAGALGRAQQARDLAARALDVVLQERSAKLTSIGMLIAAAEVGARPGPARIATRLRRIGERASPMAASFALIAEGHSLRTREPSSASLRYRDASSQLADMGVRWWAARARYLAGECGEGLGAIDDLVLARAMFDEMHADGWTRRTEGLLRSRGRRVASRRSSPRNGGEHVLSVRELEVLEELASGNTNAEIGRRLHISQHTVARHLSQIYKKLGVSSRTQAIRAGSVSHR